MKRVEIWVPLILAALLLLAFLMEPSEARDVKKGPFRQQPVYLVKFCGLGGNAADTFTPPTLDLAQMAEPPFVGPASQACPGDGAPTAAGAEQIPLGISEGYKALGMMCRVDQVFTEPVIATLMTDQVATRMTCAINAASTVPSCISMKSVLVQPASKLSMRWEVGSDDLSEEFTLCYLWIQPR